MWPTFPFLDTLSSVSFYLPSLFPSKEPSGHLGFWEEEGNRKAYLPWQKTSRFSRGEARLGQMRAVTLRELLLQSRTPRSSSRMTSKLRPKCRNRRVNVSIVLHVTCEWPGRNEDLLKRPLWLSIWPVDYWNMQPQRNGYFSNEPHARREKGTSQCGNLSAGERPRTVLTAC